MSGLCEKAEFLGACERISYGQDQAEKIFKLFDIDRSGSLALEEIDEEALRMAQSASTTARTRPRRSSSSSTSTGAGAWRWRRSTRRRYAWRRAHQLRPGPGREDLQALRHRPEREPGAGGDRRG